MQTRLLFFHTSQIFDDFMFDRNATPLQANEFMRRELITTPPEVETTAGYLSNSDETDVTVSGIQLEGAPGGLGITMLPHFRVQGDARVRPAPPPQTVSFDFASFAEAPRFAKETPIVFIADGKVVVSVSAAFDGNDAQFCYLPISYVAFKKIVVANQVTIKLGNNEYQLTSRQLGAIKTMASYVNE